jgi:hypothetical protein
VRLEDSLFNHYARTVGFNEDFSKLVLLKNFIMKISVRRLTAFLLVYWLSAAINADAQNNVGIGTSTPDASSLLELQSTTQGMLVPRMSTAQRLAIATPANGLLVFDTTVGCFYFYNSGTWQNLCGSGTSGISCWDSNGNGINDPAEDSNGDGLFNAGDCQGATGAAGANGTNGISCWDVNGNGVNDASEDVNGDGLFNTSDCAGTIGAAGPTGPAGVNGSDGINCWDTNGNGTGDLSEDINGDGSFNALDCAGPAGAAGAAGATGATGIAGADGATGATGAAGSSGSTGLAGATGATGVAGATGATGSTGVAGATGATGATGIAGLTGTTGATGAAGATGATGATGAVGLTGATGATGAAGTTGATGVMGATGIAGATGATGSAGVAGATGATGATGTAGTAGADGATGATGSTGATGPVNMATYRAVGNTNTTTNSGIMANMPGMSVTFTPMNAVCYVHFSAGGTYSPTGTDERNAWFELRVNGTLVKEFDFQGGEDWNQWFASFSYPINVTVGASTTVQIRWATDGATYTLFNNAGTDFYASRNLIVYDHP